jgi:ABC-type sugar transport system substrate-binding protein
MRQVLRLALLTALGGGLAAAAPARVQAQAYPTRTMTIVVPYPAGGPTWVPGTPSSSSAETSSAAYQCFPIRTEIEKW